MVYRETVKKALKICGSIHDGEECPKECPYRQESRICYGYEALFTEALKALEADEEAMSGYRNALRILFNRCRSAGSGGGKLCGMCSLRNECETMHSI